MKIYRPNRFIWAVTFLFLVTLTMLAAGVVLRGDGSDLLGGTLLFSIGLLCTLTVGYSGRICMEITPIYVAQIGWRSWRLNWYDFDRISVHGDAEGEIIELHDRQGKIYPAAVLLFVSGREKKAFLASVRDHASKAPNQASQPTPLKRLG